MSQSLQEAGIIWVSVEKYPWITVRYPSICVGACLWHCNCFDSSKLKAFADNNLTANVLPGTT